MLTLYTTERTLRIRAGLAMLIFAAFNVLWTSLLLPLREPPHAMSHGAIGLLGLVGAAGALDDQRHAVEIGARCDLDLPMVIWAAGGRGEAATAACLRAPKVGYTDRRSTAGGAR